MSAPDEASVRASGQRAFRVLRAAGLTEGQLREALAAHRSALKCGRGVLKDGVRTAVTRVDCGGACVCVKEYRNEEPLDWVKELLRGPRACRAWRGGQHLARKGVSIPELLAVVKQGGNTFLFTRYAEGATPLDLLLANRFRRVLPVAELMAKRGLVRQLALWLRGIHDRGVYHNDWSCKNILAAERHEGWQFWLLDLESVSPRKRLTWRRRVKNLGQLADTPAGISRTDRMRFLVAYAAGDASLARGRFPRAALAATRRRVEARERRLANAWH